jgi:mannosyltransferase
VAVVAGVAFRLYARSELWLDEALSVNIASLPVDEMFRALRNDGHPPLYYLILHGWIEVFGDGNVAVRSLSTVFAIAGLPLAWIAGRRYGGQVAGIGALVVLATSPFAVRYATEARMYSLIMLLVLLGWLAVRRALDRPSWPAMLGVAIVSGLLALTQYWSFYLLAATAVVLAVSWRRGHPRALRVLGAVLAGAIVFLPWLPSFIEQAGSTGTPWGRPERPTVVLASSFNDWGGALNSAFGSGEAFLLAWLLVMLVMLAVTGRAIDQRLVEVDLATRPHARPEAAVVFLAMAISVAVGFATWSAFHPRYTTIIFPLVVLLVGFGFSLLRGKAQFVALAAIVLLGLIGCARNLVYDRTQAGSLASYIVENGQPGDLVAFCPDQLGPAVERLLPADRSTSTFPSGTPAGLVDWDDYGDRMGDGDPGTYASELVEQAAEDATIWVVWNDGYRTLDKKCTQLIGALAALRPGGTVVAPGSAYEPAALSQFGPVQR